MLPFIRNLKDLPPLLLFLLFTWGCSGEKRKDRYADYPVYTGTQIELSYAPERSVFTLWSPRAQKVKLLRYESGTAREPLQQLDMTPATQGTWQTTVEGDLKGTFYTFQVSMDGQNWLGETPGIWAKAVGINGKRAAVIDLADTHPEGWDEDTAPPQNQFTDIILYELHYRDLSMHPNSGISYPGKFLALTERETKTPEGYSTGLDHIRQLGVSHVHLLPSFDFASIDETMSEYEIYNWGYEPMNYNVPEGSYSTDPSNPEVRIREFKQMVQALHQAGLRIVMDVVYNHTTHHLRSGFDLTAPGYFYRQWPDDSYSDASACGNEVASEREMVRRYIIESVKYWAQEYHIDGFRFDLMGIHDIETMNQLTTELAEIDPTIFVYGEGWTANASPLPLEQQAIKAHTHRMPRVSVFSDDLRDGLRGSVSEEKEAGFAGGAVDGKEESVRFGIVGGVRHPQIDYSRVLYTDRPYVSSPAQSIQYASCHDDLCLVDKLRLSVPDAEEEELIRFHKLAQTIVFTSQGVPFLRAGEELFHDKKGVHNSFESPDSINQIDWSHKSTYADIHQYHQDLIALRKAHPAFRIPTTEGVNQWLRFMDTQQSGVIAYTLGENANGDSWKEILVVFNGNRHPVSIQLPEKKWQVACINGRIDPAGKEKHPGGDTQVHASSALILFRK